MLKKPAAEINNIMGNLLYIIAVILIIGWLIGVFVFHAPAVIHLVLVIALVIIILKLVSGRKMI